MSTRFEVLKNKKVIILTATADIELYRKIYPDINLLAVDNTEITGTAQQYYISAGRSAIKNLLNDPIKVKKLKNIVLDDHIITFKKLKDEFKNSGFKVWEYGHYGKATGQDNLKGENISVIGTPYDNPIKYVLIALALGYSTKELDLENIKQHNIVKQPQWVNIKIQNYVVDAFQLMTFRNKLLRNIQMHFISAQLIQAVGRARALREEANVIIISSFPVQGAIPHKGFL